MKKKLEPQNIAGGATNLLDVVDNISMDQLAYCVTGLLCILAKADAARLPVHALAVVATWSRNCQLKHASKTTNFTIMQHMQIVNFAANYWKHFHSLRLIYTFVGAVLGMQKEFMK